MNPPLAMLITSSVTGAFVATVHAQSADRQIKYRQSVMNAQGYHFYTILGGMAKGTRPYDKDAAARSAKFIDELIEMPWDGFGPGTDLILSPLPVPDPEFAAHAHCKNPDLGGD